MIDNVFPFRAKRQGLRPIADILVDVVDELLSDIEPQKAAELRAKFGIAGVPAHSEGDGVAASRDEALKKQTLRRIREPHRRRSLQTFLELD